MNNVYKIFDWDYLKSKSNPMKVQILWNLHKKKVTELDFEREMRKARPYTFSVTKNGRKQYRPSKLRKQYKYFKRSFNFFTGEL